MTNVKKTTSSDLEQLQKEKLDFYFYRIILCNQNPHGNLINLKKPNSQNLIPQWISRLSLSEQLHIGLKIDLLVYLLE